MRIARRLTLEERETIERLVNKNYCDAQIARALDRSQCVVYNEFLRVGGKQGYVAQKAHQIAQNSIKRGVEAAELKAKSLVELKEKRLKDLRERGITSRSTSVKECLKDLIAQLQSITDNLGSLHDRISGETS